MHSEPAIPPAEPRVSVLISAYRAEATIERCLLALRGQTFRSFEVILTDSSPGEETARIAARFPEVRFVRHPSRLYPHEARNGAVKLARGELLASVDADVYAHPQWLEQLVAEHDRGGGVIVGAIACHGRRIRDLGMHFCKFAPFLPAGEVRSIDTGPTASLLLLRADYERVGGMKGERYLADVTLGRALTDLGRQLRFAPAAVVEHHHTQTVFAFLRERFERGKLYGRLRSGWLERRGSLAMYLLASVLPIRIVRIAGITWGHCRRAHALTALMLSFPLVLGGHAAWLAGEAVAYAGALSSKKSRRV